MYLEWRDWTTTGKHRKHIVELLVKPEMQHNAGYYLNSIENGITLYVAKQVFSTMFV